MSHVIWCFGLILSLLNFGFIYFLMSKIHMCDCQYKKPFYEERKHCKKHETAEKKTQWSMKA